MGVGLVVFGVVVVSLVVRDTLLRLRAGSVQAREELEVRLVKLEGMLGAVQGVMGSHEKTVKELERRVSLAEVRKVERR